MRSLALLLLFLGTVLAALPPLLGPGLPPGTELRLFSQDLRILHGAWRVEGKRLIPLSAPIPPRLGQEVQLLLVLPGEKPRTFPGVADRGDVVLLQDKERVSLLRLLKEVYGLAPPERLWP
ncbi:hypothetical protein HRbin38_00382 [bacterium HR38]|uniref:Uncharacterized protein n=1 Tax=Thermus scotoductus TaxID=37636 RepID=A0A0N0IPS6_THESC|nr:hypothetical protein [Thermus sp. NMX2.A1]ETN88272.1 hypothetical protein TNMX_07680 [Thermus sp. NMX2.A1]KPD25993.1 hypothetical protein AN926_11750 [Thermus scotoductus]GBD40520.1 hypothetical protein HRbin38_00382 [bacterium HR38]